MQVGFNIKCILHPAALLSLLVGCSANPDVAEDTLERAPAAEF